MRTSAFRSLFRSCAAAISMIVLSGLATACGSDEGSSPNAPSSSTEDGSSLDTFVPVRVSTTSVDGVVHSVFLTESGGGVVTGNGPSIEAWVVFSDKSTMHIRTDGPRDAPTATHYEWDNQSLTIDESTGEATYVTSSGTSETFTVSSTSQALTDEEAKQQDKKFDDDSKWFMQLRHSPQLGYIAEKFDNAKAGYEKLKKSVAKALDEVATAYTVYTSKPIVTSLNDFDPVKLVKELEARSHAKPPSSTQLPEDVQRRESEGSTTFVPATYEPPRVPCVKGFGEGQSKVREERACAASKEACEAAGGVAAEGPKDYCSDWCTTLGGRPKVEEASPAADIDSLVCYPRTCVDDFSKPKADEPFEPFRGAAACNAGCTSSLCGDTPSPGGDGTADTPEECKAEWAPLLFGHTWKVTEAIENIYDGTAYVDRDLMVKNDKFDDYVTEWTFEISADGRVHERKVFISSGTEYRSDLWELNPGYATDPVEKHFTFMFSNKYNGYTASSPSYCTYTGLGWLVRLQGQTLEALQYSNKGTNTPTKMKLTQQ